MKADFFIIGAMKCGTTTLSEYLQNHPGVSFCKNKESDFFSKSKDWKNELPNYESLFEEGDYLYGEGSTTYTALPEVNLHTARSIYEYNPQARLIYIMRDPVDRLISHYMHSYSRGYISDSLEEVLFTRPSLINRGRYFMQLSEYLKYFPREQILLLLFDDLRNDLDGVLKKVCSFLGLEFIPQANKIHQNRSVNKQVRNHKMDGLYKFIYRNELGKKLRLLVPRGLRKSGNKLINKTGKKLTEKPNLSQDQKTALKTIFLQDIENLEKLMGVDLEKWK